jgi:phage/plasmid-associated DNA primase
MTGTGAKYESIMSMYSTVLYGNNINEMFFVITGSGGNGKNVLDNLMNKVIGDSFHQKLDVNQLINPSTDPSKANSNLFNARTSRMLVSSEPDGDNNAKIKTAVIKQLTGDGKISCRDLHRSQISYIANFVLFMYCNDMPNLSTIDGGVTRRMKLITMPYKFVHTVVETTDRLIDVTLKHKIEHDMRYRNGMLYLLLDIWRKYKGIFFESVEIQTETREYFENQNPLREWAEQFEETTTQIKSLQKGSTLMADYNNSLSPHEQDKKIPPSQMKRFYRFMDQLGFRHYLDHKVKHYYVNHKQRDEVELQ